MNGLKAPVGEKHTVWVESGSLVVDLEALRVHKPVNLDDNFLCILNTHCREDVPEIKRIFTATLKSEPIKWSQESFDLKIGLNVVAGVFDGEILDLLEVLKVYTIPFELLFVVEFQIFNGCKLFR